MSTQADAAGQEVFATNRSLADSYFPTYGALPAPGGEVILAEPCVFSTESR